MTNTLTPTEIPNIEEGSITIPDETLEDKGVAKHYPLATPAEEDTHQTRTPEDQDMFPRDVVEKLRRENAAARTKAKDRDTLAQRLHRVLVEQTGRLADATDLPFDEAHLADPEALTAAIDELLTRKPHLAARTFHGNIGQGATTEPASIDLAAILRHNA